MSDETTRKTVHFWGEVQGVGFRYTALQVAQGRPVVGFVQNRANGSVEMVVEGRPDAVEGFINALSYRMRGHIHRTEMQETEATGEFDGFNIRR